MERNLKEWKSANDWVKCELKDIYPPKYLSMIPGVEEVIKNENFHGKKVIDVGCGVGGFAKMIKDRGARVIGVDPSETLLKEASKYIPVAAGSAYHLPFPSESFDYGISLDVIIVLEDIKKPLEEFSRVLRKGGKACMCIVNPNSERWNEKTLRCYEDQASINRVERRPWIFNLENGEHFIKHYFHRPFSFYEKEISRHFEISRILETRLPKENFNSGKYARREYLIFELMKK